MTLIEVDERSTPQLPRITYMRTPITEKRNEICGGLNP